MITHLHANQNDPTMTEDFEINCLFLEFKQSRET